MHRHSPPRPGAPFEEMSERGASLVEYVLMLSLIALVALGSVTAVGDTLSDSVDDSASRVAWAGP
jgi:Flp pilus assembly pilin Flp